MFIAQSTCKTKRELKDEQAPSSKDQLSEILGAQNRVSRPQVVRPHVAVKAVTAYSDFRRFGMLEGKSSKYKERIVALGKYIPVS